MTLVCQEIMDIVEMINHLNQSIYEQGTVLDRIENYLTEAEAHVVQGVAELEKAITIQQGYNPLDPKYTKEVDPKTGETKKVKRQVKDKANLNRLRGVTYSILTADFVFGIINIVIVYVKKNK